MRVSPRSRLRGALSPEAGLRRETLGPPHGIRYDGGVVVSRILRCSQAVPNELGRMELMEIWGEWGALSTARPFSWVKKKRYARTGSRRGEHNLTFTPNRAGSR